MPQVDLETLVSACAGGTDRKIACETLADTKDGDSTTTAEENDDVQDTEPSKSAGAEADYPPESFWLSKDAEFDWFDRNAFYERKESTKGGISHSASSHIHPNSTSSSQRFSLNLTSTSKASIIGLPKTQKASYVDGKRRNGGKPGNIRLLPKRPPIGKQASTLTEPSSPKVSCMGRVRSKRKSRRSSEPDKRKDKPVVRSKSEDKKRKTGFGAKFMAIFRSGKGQKKPVDQRNGGKVAEKSAVEEAPRKIFSASKSVRENPIVVEPVGDPPGLGGMKRFASGRRSTDEFDGVVAGSFELGRVGPAGSS